MLHLQSFVACRGQLLALLASPIEMMQNLRNLLPEGELRSSSASTSD